MMNIFRTALSTDRVTTAYPHKLRQPPPAFRGRPIYREGACDCKGECMAACPTGAITVHKTWGATSWELDMAGCVFCGLCETACPGKAISFSADFELAARRREDLVVRANTGIDSSPLRSKSLYDPEALGQQFSKLARRSLRRSLHVRHMDAGSDNSTDWELNTLLNPVYDIQRLGIDIVASPRHADLLFVTGAVTRNLALALQRTYEAMPAPRLVIAAGSEACGGGVLRGSYAIAGGVDQCLPVDVYIPGDPPRPEAIIFGLLMAMDRL